MSAAADVVRAPTSRRLVVTLARLEARRHLRSPVLLLALPGTLYLTFLMSDTDDWEKFAYTNMPIIPLPLYLAVSVLVAASFRRERARLAEDAPTSEAVHAAGRLLGSGVLVLLVVAVTVAHAVAAYALGGLQLGEKPGQTLHAHHTLPEMLQPVFVALVAVALGDLLGRRTASRATTTVILFVTWYFAGAISWLFQAAPVRPFSIIQLQPVLVRAGPEDADPLTFPETWLLEPANEYQPFWGRWIVSPELVVAHDVWLVGLACLLVAFALPRTSRDRLLVVGGVLATLAVIAQYAVAP